MSGSSPVSAGPLVEEQAHDLLGEQRVAAGPLRHRRDHLVASPPAAGQQRRDQALRLLWAQRVEEQRRRASPAATPAGAAIEQLVARQAYDHQRRAHPLREVLDQVEHAVVGPVDVLEHERQRAAQGHRLDHRTHRGEEVLSRPRRVHRLAARIVRRGAEAEQARDERRLALGGLAPGLARRLGQQLVDLGRELRPGDVGRVAVGDPALRPQDLGERPVHDARAVGQAASLAQRGGGFVTLQGARQLAGQPRLAHAGLPDDRDEVGPALADDAAVGGIELGELVVASHEARLARRGGPAHRLRREHSHGLPRRNGLGLPLELELADLAVFDRVAGGAHGALAHRDLSRPPRGLEAGGDVDRVPGHRIGVAHGPGEDLAGVQPDAQGEVDLVLAGGVGVDLLHRRLHAQRGADGPLGVVLVGHRGSEQGHDVVADVLVHGPAEALDLVAQTPQAALHHRLDRLGVHALGDRGIAREVGEQDRHLPALLGRYLRAPGRRSRRGGPRLDRGPAGGAEARARAERSRRTRRSDAPAPCRTPCKSAPLRGSWWSRTRRPGRPSRFRLTGRELPRGVDAVGRRHETGITLVAATHRRQSNSEGRSGWVCSTG